MLDIKLIRSNPELVKENIKKKFQDEKLPLVDEVLELDAQFRASKGRGDELRQQRNTISKEIGKLMSQGKKDEAQEVKKQVQAIAGELEEMERKEAEMTAEIRKRMLVIPNLIDDSVPIGKDDSENVEVQRFGEPVVPEFEVPYHTEIMERFGGIDLDSARKTSGNGFYYLMGDIARLQSAVISYARDFMIEKGFTYCIPPFMIHGNIVEGVMSQTDMDAMMYKIEGEDLYLIGTSEHSMIGKYIDTILPEETLPQTLTSYSPCFRKEKGAHGIEERGVYRIHQFEKQEMIVICKPEDSMAWYDKMWSYSVELFRSLDIPVRQLECCSGDLADLKVKSCDIEAWSPRQKKYFEVCSCSNMGDAQARRLKIRVKGEDGQNYLPHTLNNTVVAPPRMLIAFLENNLQADGSVRIPEALRPYMGGGQLVDVVQGGADEQPVAQAVEGAAQQHAPEGIGPQPQEQALQAHEDGRAHHQHPQGEPPAQAHHQQQEGDFQQSAPAHEDAVPLGRHPGVGHKVGEEGALAAGGDVQQQPEKQQADVGLVLEQLPQVQLLLARGLPGGLGVGLPGEEGEEHGDKGQQAGHPEGGGHPHRGQQKGDEEAANHKEEGAHAAQQAVVEPQLVGVAHQNVFGIGAHGAPEEVHHRHQAEEQPGGDGQPGGNQGDKGKEQASPQQHQDEHLPQGAHAVADHAPKGHRGNGEDRGQGV